MFAQNIFKVLIISTIATILSSQIEYCFCWNLKEINVSSASSFSPAVATWYGEPRGAGSGGACGFENNVANPPYNGLISAGNNNLFKQGKGCGACYQVVCTKNPACSGNAITVTVTDECPGACNNDAVHFDLSGTAFGRLAKPGLDDQLRKAGRIDIEYQRVPCHYNSNIFLKIDSGSNPFYLAFAIEGVNGDGDLGFVELLPSNSNTWISMQQSFGASWKTQLPNGAKGPYSVRITTIESKRSVVAQNVIPFDWAPGKFYVTTVNF